MSATDEATDEKAAEKIEGKKAPKDAPPAHLGWNSHESVVSNPLRVYYYFLVYGDNKIQ